MPPLLAQSLRVYWQKPPLLAQSRIYWYKSASIGAQKAASMCSKPPLLVQSRLYWYNCCATDSGSPEFELMFCPLLILFKYRTGGLTCSRIHRSLTGGQSQLRQRVVVPARQPCSQAWRYDNPMTELTLSYSQESMNLAYELSLCPFIYYICVSLLMATEWGELSSDQ
jgi:hypothetical protein